jgi:hypothetical protein
MFIDKYQCLDLNGIQMLIGNTSIAKWCYNNANGWIWLGYNIQPK